MKKLIVFVLLAMASIVMADSWVWDVTDSSVSTNESAASGDTITSGRIRGYVDALSLAVTTDDASPTCTVHVVTSSSHGCGAARTIFSNTVTATSFNLIRIQADDTAGSSISGQYGKIPLYDDKVEFRAYNRTTGSNISIRCVLYYSDEP